ncbi:agmatine deiminase [Mangrovimicrobium sediminis]|uniref:Putative agmatine deiminase n=1 Tax=Mangrovimicrobium sediminis TaxID=2562682 RepID=A0A4Z0M013_9GAMM|nr:agmatine deiminase [Haliea sp. SAOS-164]TGD72776.1 agmatine deiminase [Haliea sp. SAOS-164]
MNRALVSTPRADGFHMPAEHAPQQAVLMAWPERPDNWRGNAGPAGEAFAAVAAAIQPATPVVMCVSPASEARARALLPAEVKVLIIPSNDSWMRDIGPSFVVNGAGGLRGVDWPFNAWGGAVDGLYDDWSLDDAMAEQLLEWRGVERYRAPLIMEGGAIHVDGEGTCYTTAECLLHPSRNPQLGRTAIETCLGDYLGVDSVIWLPHGLYNDETNGHVDNILHVVGPGEVALTWCDDPGDPMYAICREAGEALAAARDARGRTPLVHRLPLPGPLYVSETEAAGVTASAGMARHAGERLAASYANFLISNERVVFPLLDPAQDDAARDALASLFPSHTIVGVPGREILLGGGNIHCITQQVPQV